MDKTKVSVETSAETTPALVPIPLGSPHPVPKSMWGKIALAILAPWTSRKLWFGFIGLSVIITFFWTSVNYLYSFTDQAHIAAFEAMFQTTAYTVGVIVCFVVGATGFTDGMKRTITSSAITSVQSLIPKKEPKDK